MSASFDELVEQAQAHPFEGWDFSFLGDRVWMAPLPWDYAGRVDELFSAASVAVDLGTGGGEFLAERRRPRLTVATEGWRPNVAVAARTLGPLGAHVVEVEGAPDNVDQSPEVLDGRLPFRTGSVDVVTDRHEAFRAAEVARILRPGGTFLTQQVGGRNDEGLNALLGAGAPPRSPTLAGYRDQLRSAGLEVVEAREAFARHRFSDVGAIVAHLLAVPWQTNGFSVAAYRERLRAVHENIAAMGALEVHAHRLMLEAVKP